MPKILEGCGGPRLSKGECMKNWSHGMACVALSFCVASCGNDDAPVPPAPPPLPLMISVSPGDVGVIAGGTQQFSCTVTGSANTQCNWSVREQVGGGTINGTGLYTAPPTAGVFTVIATAAADSTKSATAIVRVSAVSGGGQNVVRPGLGNDPGTPLVSPLNLPRGVQIDGLVIGTDAEGPGCRDADARIGGSGAPVRACVSLCTDQFTGPNGEVWNSDPGLILISEFQDGQNGLLHERVRIEVPRTACTGGFRSDETDEERRRRFIVEIGFHCLNASRSPSFDRMRYRLAGRTLDPDLLELLSILQTKRVETEEHRNLVQEAVYAITESTGLTHDLRTRLHTELPNA